jgi:hypothetical protein
MDDIVTIGPHVSAAPDETGPPEFAPLEEAAADKPAAKLLLWYGDTPPKPPRYLVDETIPEIGVRPLEL